MGTSEGGHQKERHQTHAEHVPILLIAGNSPLLTNMEEAVPNKAYIESHHSNNGPRNLGNNTSYTEKEKYVENETDSE